jgi:hypothetical protein
LIHGKIHAEKVTENAVGSEWLCRASKHERTAHHRYSRRRSSSHVQHRAPSALSVIRSIVWSRGCVQDVGAKTSVSPIQIALAMTFVMVLPSVKDDTGRPLIERDVVETIVGYVSCDCVFERDESADCVMIDESVTKNPDTGRNCYRVRLPPAGEIRGHRGRAGWSTAGIATAAPPAQLAGRSPQRLPACAGRAKYRSPVTHAQRSRAEGSCGSGVPVARGAAARLSVEQVPRRLLRNRRSGASILRLHAPRS